jgi:hypothetical protein
MKKKQDPLDVVIRKIRMVYDDAAFIRNLKITLYASYAMEEYNVDNFVLDNYMRQEMLAKNTTLQAVIKCCQASEPNLKGLQSIITYNYYLEKRPATHSRKNSHLSCAWLPSA